MGWGGPYGFREAKGDDLRLTLLDGAHDVGFELVVRLEHVGEAQSGELSRSLSAVSVEHREAAIVARSF